MESDIYNLAELFKVFSDPTRLKLIKLLAASNMDQCVSDLALKLKITQPATSQHIRVLKGLGFISSTKKANKVFYRVDNIKFQHLKQNIDGFFRKTGFSFPETM
jgi:ArsR family transcriptional regulator, arsenate/arsenite/antimonite-responsive transcriptional repressor